MHPMQPIHSRLLDSHDENLLKVSFCNKGATLVVDLLKRNPLKLNMNIIYHLLRGGAL
jgi:hypothetical protein